MHKPCAWYNYSMSDFRVLVVDASHLAYIYAHSRQLFANTPQGKVNTTIQTGIIKAVHRWSQGGRYPTVVAFDRRCPQRSNFVSQISEDWGGGYKADRHRPAVIREALNQTEWLLNQGGVMTVSMEGYEADDLVAAAVMSAKAQFPKTPIDVVTSDMDLVPLVDDWVSVFMRSQQRTWAAHKTIEKNRYEQILPDNYSTICEGKSMFKSHLVPFNTVFLLKVLRGDKSDSLCDPVLKKAIPPRVWNQMVSEMVADGLSFGYVDLLRNDWVSQVLPYLEKWGKSDVDYRTRIENMGAAMLLNNRYPGFDIYSDRLPIGRFELSGYKADDLRQSVKELQITLS